MKVRCIKLIDEQTGKVLESSSWLTVDKEYRVLSIYMQDTLPIKFQIIGNDWATPAYHNANQFEIITTFIPSDWIVDFETGSYFKIAPKEWCKPGFWEDYYDGMPEALALFDSVKDKLIQEEPD